jgi:hypothetical protein
MSVRPIAAAGPGTLLLALMLAATVWQAMPGDHGRAPAFQTIGAATGKLRLRAEPEPSSPVLLLVPEGVEIAVLGRAKNGFYPAAYGAIRGWALTGSVETPPAPPKKGAEALAALRAEQRARTDARLNVRANPAPDAPVIATLNRHAVAPLTGASRGGYLEVESEAGRGWIEGRFLSAPGVRGAVPEYRRRDIIRIIHEAADHYGQPREDMLRVARCESDLIPNATNSVGGSYGLFQFKPFTWEYTPYAEYDIFDPRANALAAAWMWSVGNKHHWVCQ